MRTTGSLISFRVAGVGIMLFALLHVAADVFSAYLDITQGDPVWRGWGLTDLPRLLTLPIFFFAMGASLYVLVEIAGRLARFPVDPFPEYSRED